MSPSRRVLLVDHHDSYVGNLLQLIWCEVGVRPDVVESDAMDVVRIVEERYSHIVLGPGPGTPLDECDVGGTLAVVRQTRSLILGVCFGMQAIAVSLGGGIRRLLHPAHGVTSTIGTGESQLFRGMPTDIDVVRYHSLHVPEPLPPPLRPSAWTADGVLMALEAVPLGLYGVQFHPESIGTFYGARVVSNFLDLPPTEHDRRSVGFSTSLETTHG
ncbi:type 1 glutamine amidotransferase [Rathayibacter toxicus]|uniref:anthranilate synthase component II n=1 Tax=Rathayibacter toxicus TaxID=145458 RepID=UPI0009E5855E|nr:aminodeoxychorismate/anthranilate synthase component II [Rathayibacter toxicus]PPG20309.1 type 1 glutamine amidotransferase [Rathayibacter toxicus]PPG45410.1 type 1 glutamine amidotransferase [Rathayibacter toxicus]PPH62856.1 type 1 glutamine amidotransferase [Rathayibacter toxicus]PPH66604.1 type 1 glutamine amidotransferase [Rathayibacter toxicus]PPH72193.1 type 1 glutamine amidotransferase [Rathayibacter toxicus]